VWGTKKYQRMDRKKYAVLEPGRSISKSSVLKLTYGRDQTFLSDLPNRGLC
jgi:hypothetical protein